MVEMIAVMIRTPEKEKMMALRFFRTLKYLFKIYVTPLHTQAVQDYLNLVFSCCVRRLLNGFLCYNFNTNNHRYLLGEGYVCVAALKCNDLFFCV